MPNTTVTVHAHAWIQKLFQKGGGGFQGLIAFAVGWGIEIRGLFLVILLWEFDKFKFFQGGLVSGLTLASTHPSLDLRMDAFVDNF